jgi:histidyl-tRNA synthetase
MTHQAPRGTRDVLPGEIERWQWAEQQARVVLDRYGFGEIRTPLFEDFELFARTSGESSDVVQKEMYRFQDRKGRDLALRPEGTAPVARAYIEHGMAGESRIHRLWYMGPMFRYGRPQKGRYRQFHHIGGEIIGTAAAAADVEIIALFVDIFVAWGFENLKIAINSVGTPETRRGYAERLRSWLAPVHDRLSADSQNRLLANPLRVLDSKDPADLRLLSELGDMPRLLDCVDSASLAHWDLVLAGLAAVGVDYEIDHGLVRGLDYYTRTAFELHDPSLGPGQSALGGGGRYDGLIASLGGSSTPGVGFSIGFDRVMLVLAERGTAIPSRSDSIYVVSMNATHDAALALVRELRRDFRVLFDLEARSFGAQMKAAGKSGARLAVLLGEDEWERGAVALKDLTDGTQDTVPRIGLKEALRVRFARQGEESRTL